jgi:hypothetical protein
MGMGDGVAVGVGDETTTGVGEAARVGGGGRGVEVGGKVVEVAVARAIGVAGVGNDGVGGGFPPQAANHTIKQANNAKILG